MVFECVIGGKVMVFECVIGGKVMIGGKVHCGLYVCDRSQSHGL